MNELIFAHIEDNTVSNTIVATMDFVTDHPELTLIDITNVDPRPGPNWEYIDGNFNPPVDTNSLITLTIPENPLPIATDISVSATIKDSSGTTVDVNETYYVPVIRKSDNMQSAFLVFKFVNGVATVTFKLSDSGIYTVKMDDISPKPTAILQGNVELIVI